MATEHCQRSALTACLWWLSSALAAGALGCGSDVLTAPSPAASTPWWSGGTELWLSQTGLYSDIASKTLATGSTAFQPRFQLWSDGAAKQRWLRLPARARIGNSQPDEWQLPVGAVVFKEFARDGKRLETRVLARTGPGARDYWLGAFAWNEQETDARHVPQGVPDARGTGHDIPSSKRCGTCHDGAPGRVLGLSAVQQPELPPEWLQAPTLAVSVPGEPATQAALGYLHANCAHCHNPRGSAFPDTDLDLRLASSDRSPDATLAQRTTLSVPLQFFRRTSTRWRVLPGQPEQSALLERMSEPDPLVRMPPLGTEQIDAAGVATVREWIESLAP